MLAKTVCRKFFVVKVGLNFLNLLELAMISFVIQVSSAYELTGSFIDCNVSPLIDFNIHGMMMCNREDLLSTAAILRRIFVAIYVR